MSTFSSTIFDHVTTSADKIMLLQKS